MHRRNAIWSALKVLSVLLVLSLIFLALRGIGLRRILQAWRKAGESSLCSALLLYLTVFVLWTFRWQQLMNPDDRRSIFALFEELLEDGRACGYPVSSISRRISRLREETSEGTVRDAN